MVISDDPPSHAAESAGDRVENQLTGLLLSRDLIFTTKVRGTAAELGFRVLVAGDMKHARSVIAASAPRVVFVDLTAGDLVAPAALKDYQLNAGAETWFIAFGPHVEERLLGAAKDAGCQVVMARSKFAAELPAIIGRYLGAHSPNQA